MDNTRDIFKKRLKALRGERSVNSIAAEIGIAPLTLTRYENGERLPDIDRAADIAKYYGVSIDWLLGIEEKRQSQTEYIGSVCEYTGLSKQSIEDLHNISLDNTPKEIKDKVLSEIISEEFIGDVILNLWVINEQSKISKDNLTLGDILYLCEKHNVKFRFADFSIVDHIQSLKSHSELLEEYNENRENDNVELYRYRNIKLIEKINDIFDHSKDLDIITKEQLIEMVSQIEKEYHDELEKELSEHKKNPRPNDEHSDGE